MAESRLSHDERRERRTKIADAVRQGASAAEVAQEFGVTTTTVYAACRESGVATPRPQHDRVLAIVAALQNDPTRVQADIAAEFGVSRLAVQGVLLRARAKGIRFPGRHRRGQRHG